MEEKAKKSAGQVMRQLHRDAGFLILSFVIINALSGIILTYRNTDLLKHDVKTERKIDPGLDAAALGGILRIRDFKVLGEENGVVSFQGGSYDKNTGVVNMTIRDVIFPFNKLMNYHKAISNNPKHWSNVIFGVILLFMAVSSFWMYKPGSMVFKRVMIIMAVGLVITLILVFTGK